MLGLYLLFDLSVSPFWGGPKHSHITAHKEEWKTILIPESLLSALGVPTKLQERPKRNAQKDTAQTGFDNVVAQSFLLLLLSC
eukprot:5808954-Amphidinium_carterae.1